MSEAEAEELINEAREAFDIYIAEGEIDLAEDVCGEYFGLEPDYLDELV